MVNVRSKATTVLALLSSALMASVTGAQAASDLPRPPPNIVFILLDDARYDDMVAMPEVVRLVGQAGATLSHFYAPFPLCCPARATLLTGQYAHNHGVVSNFKPTGGWTEFDDASTLATWLDPTYRTGLVGKYLNEYKVPYVPPGWDEWMVPRGVYNFTYPAWFIKRGTAAGTTQQIPGYQTDTMGDLASDFITRNAPSDEPFFLEVSVVAPHAGLPADPDDTSIPSTSPKLVYRDAFLGTVNTDPSFNEADVSDKPSKPALLSAQTVAGLTESFQQRREAMLSAQDAIVQIVDTLEAQAELDNTYIVFMSDNGHLLGEHRIRYDKKQPYEVSNHVPMMVRGPGIVPGTVISDATSQVDFAPTVLAMAGAASPAPGRIDGVDLLPLLTGTGTLNRSAILIEATSGKSSPDPLPWIYHGIVDERWKYIERSSGARELYDLANDPYELDNLARRSEFSAERNRLAAMLNTDRWCVGNACRD
jgi:N-acetylglucosamine-6-sulfatase